jgi:DNA mismatch repair protein MSH4
MPTPTLQSPTRSCTRESTPTSGSHASILSFHSGTASTGYDIQSNNNHKAARSHSHPNTRRSKNSGTTSTKSTGGTGGGKDGQNFVAAVVEGRGTGAEVGMCFCDLKTSEVILCQVPPRLSLFLLFLLFLLHLHPG